MHSLLVMLMLYLGRKMKGWLSLCDDLYWLYMIREKQGTSVICVNFRAFLAAASAHSFPIMPMCEGTHVITICGLPSGRAMMLLYSPLRFLVSAFVTLRLSVHIIVLPFFRMEYVIAEFIPASSAEKIPDALGNRTSEMVSYWFSFICSTIPYEVISPWKDPSVYKINSGLKDDILRCRSFLNTTGLMLFLL